ncbi:MAG: DUF4179 domain-containing protein [Christensenellales bacterium]|nr:DUF4179 domain-containing protein [Christensenellales bacterium]
MDNRMKEKIRSGRLSRQDVRQMVDWQLSLDSERIDVMLLQECLMFLDPRETLWVQEERERLWSRIKAAAFAHRRRRVGMMHHAHRISARAVLLAALLLLLTGAAMAAVWGLFGRFSANPENEWSRQRLEHLEKVAQTVGKTVEVVTPAAALSQIDLTTDYGRIQAQQYGRKLELTVDQVYCDGNKLYYSYRVSEKNRTFELLEGAPTGFENETWFKSDTPEKVCSIQGMTPEEYFCSSGMTPEQQAEISAWFAAHPRAYVVRSYFGLGDGADLYDGTEKGQTLNIFDSGVEWTDPHTKTGFQQVDLPEGYVPGETITFLMPVLYGTEVLRQDETGVYSASVSEPESRGYIRVPVTAKVTGKPEEMTKTVAFEDYTATVHLAISDVDISGKVYFEGVEDWEREFQREWAESEPYDCDWVTSYTLIADGQKMPNVYGGYGIGNSDDCWNVWIRYDLPPSMEHLTLVPERSKTGVREDESIIIR